MGLGARRRREAGSAGRAAAVRSMAQKIIRAVSKSKRPVARTRLTSARLQCNVAARIWDTPAEDKGTASRPSHVVETGAGVEAMAAAGAASNGGSPAAQAAGKDVVAGTNDEARTHRDLRWVI